MAPAMDEDLAEIVGAAARRPEALDAVRDLYRRAGEEIDRRGPRCELSGRCCRFDEYGHLLYVTTLEVALFLDDLRAAARAPAGPAGGGCPFQEGKACSVHGIRPLGCRMFFCDPAAGWLPDFFERLHRELREIHERSGIPYRYVEWRRALAAIRKGD